MKKQIFKGDNVNSLIDEQVKSIKGLTQKLITTETISKEDEIASLILNRYFLIMMICIIRTIFKETREAFKKYHIREEFISSDFDSKYYKKEYENIPTIDLIRNNLYHALSIIIEKLSNILDIVDSIELSNMNPELFTKASECFAHYSIIDELFKNNYNKLLEFLDYFIEKLQCYQNERKEDI